MRAFWCSQAGIRPVLALMLLGLPGCWVQTYETRLQNTRDLYARFEARNKTLQDYWSDNGGVKIRPMRSFNVIPPPEPPPVPEKPKPGEEPITEEPPPPPPDLRQPIQIPDFLPLELFGLRGAWRHDIPVQNAEGQMVLPTGAPTAALYVLSNRGIHKPEGEDAPIPVPGKDPKLFCEDVCKLFADSQPALAELTYAKCVPSAKPGSPTKFVDQVNYKATNFPYATRMSNGQEINWVVSLYFYEPIEDAEQVAIITIERQSHAGTFSQAIDLCLETLNVDVAAFQNEGNAAAAAPGGGL